ncbi:MAG: 7-carboxy-7-deazaguanine synthase [Gemmatimonadales bacterium]
MTYTVKEIYHTLQGEGRHTGRPAVFLRFTGCNLWTGQETDRGQAVCQFCDTDFVGADGPGGGKFPGAVSLAQAVRDTWPDGDDPYVVLTGGEPLLQLDAPLINALHTEGFTIGLETNGTLPVPPGVEWICVSPKANAPLVQTTGHELKLVYPQAGAEPARYEHLAFDHFFLQPMDGPDRERHTAMVLAYCAAHPRWQVSLQTHKLLGIP